MSVLNNEVDILNVANIDNDIRDSYTRDMIAGEEKETYSTHNYDVNEFFIWNDRKLYKTLSAISTGDTFVLNTNIKLAGNISDQLYQLFAQSPESIRAILSNVEEGSTASKNYHVGDYILWTDGFLYKVIANTNIGTAWTVGTNIQLKSNITDEITSLNSALTNEVSARAKNGAHNLLKNTVTTHVENGVQFTKYTTDESFLVNGTNSSSSAFDTYIASNITANDLPSGNYVFSSGAVANNDKYYFVVDAYNDSTYVKTFGYLTTNNTLNLSVDWSNYNKIVIIFKIRGSQNVSSVRFYPMIRLATDADPTYTPYAMTNQQLTENLAVKSETITPSAYRYNQTTFSVYKTGRTVFFYGNTISSDLPGDGQFHTIATIPQGFRPLQALRLSGFLDGNNITDYFVVDIFPNGEVAVVRMSRNTTLASNVLYNRCITYLSAD